MTAKNIAYYLNRELRYVRDTIGYCDKNIEAYERVVRGARDNDVKELYKDKINDTKATRADMLEDEKLIEYHLTQLK